jgi:beta-phosphoglucomutase
MLKGVLFDMDGVLADSEEFICRAAIKMFSEYGVTVHPDDFKPFVGTGENSYLGGVALKNNIEPDIEKIKARTYEIYSELATGSLKPLPGGSDFLMWCIGNGLKSALVTSADAVKVEVTLREIGIDKNCFDAIITGSDVERKKPFPDIYIKATYSLGLKPEECLVVEDAISGIRAGKSAGCKCLAVATSFPPEMLAEAHWVCNTLNEVPVGALNW